MRQKQNVRVFVLLILFFASIASCQVSQQQILTKAVNQVSFFTTPIGTLFEQIPTISQIKYAILSDDTLSLTKLHQALLLGKENLPCDQKARYIDMVLGFLKTAIWDKKNSMASLSQEINQAKSQVAGAQSAVNSLNQQLISLNVEQKRNALNQVVLILQDRYDKFNKASDELIKLENTYQSSQTRLNSLSVKNKENRDVANQKKNELSSTDKEIADLEERLKNLKDKRVRILNELKASLEIITTSQSEIEQLEIRTDLISFEVENLKKIRNGFSNEVITLESQVSALKNNLIKTEEKQKQLHAQLDEKKKELFDIQNKLGLEKNLQNIQNVSFYLEGMVPKFIQLNYITYYECFTKEKLNKEDAVGIKSYHIRGDLVREYLKNLFGNNVSLPDLSYLIDLELGIKDQFSRSWNERFGVIFKKDNYNPKNLTFSGDLSCSEKSSSLASGVATIKDMKEGKVYVSNYFLGEMQLRIGACTRIESVTGLPQIGQTVYFKGLIQNNIWNLYLMTSF